jgi:hypothetical protein
MMETQLLVVPRSMPIILPMIYSCGFLKNLDMLYLWVRGGFSRGFEEFLNAEGAKVTQRAQKRGEKEYKNKKNRFNQFISLNLYFSLPFVFSLSSSALSAQPSRPLRSKNVLKTYKNYLAAATVTKAGRKTRSAMV